MANNHKQGPAKARSAANSLITAVAVIGGLVFVNIIGSRYFGRADLTEDRIYKLSKVSLDTVKNLPDRMNVKAFISGDLPPQMNSIAQYARDMLDEYAAASGGKLVWESIDPTGGKDKEEKERHKDELSKYKIQKMTIETIKDTKLELGGENYLGIGFAYADQIESVPSLTSTEGLEFQITGVIRKLVNTKKHKVGFATSEGELQRQPQGPGGGMQMIGQFLSDYDVSDITLDKPIPDDIEALVIAGPKQPFNEKVKFHIDQFLMKGKAVAFFVDGMTLESPQGMQLPGMEQPKIGRQNDTNLTDLFEKYGLKLRDDLVLDKQNVIGLVPVNGGMRPTNYPTFVAVVEDGLAKDHMLTSKVKALVTPFTSSVELVGDLKDGKVEGVKATAVARTSEGSWRNSGFFLFNPTQKLAPPASESDKGPFVLGYAVEGKLKSALSQRRGRQQRGRVDARERRGAEGGQGRGAAPGHGLLQRPQRRAPAAGAICPGVRPEPAVRHQHHRLAAQGRLDGDAAGQGRHPAAVHGVARVEHHVLALRHRGRGIAGADRDRAAAVAAAHFAALQRQSLKSPDRIQLTGGHLSIPTNRGGQ